MLLFFHNGRTAKKQCRQDACTALDWVAGLFFQSGRLLGLIMQAIATIIGADLGGLPMNLEHALKNPFSHFFMMYLLFLIG